MDLSDPTRAVTPTLDGPVLVVLATAGRPMTVSEVAAQAVRGSEIGIRRCLARLVDQGLVRATSMGRNQVHELNRDHVAAPIADLFAGLRLELWSRLRAELSTWPVPPLYACVFGSAARGDGDDRSDIDVLMVHPLLIGETTLAGFGRNRPAVWHEQVDRLRDLVQRWTGNPLQAIDLSVHEWREPSSSLAPLLAEAKRDAIDLVRSPDLPTTRPAWAGHG
jgi:predicted nucleotidyltransferase